MFKIYWTSEDKQGDVCMGEFATRGEAEGNLMNAKAELLSQALDNAEDPDGSGKLMTKRAVEAGTWSIFEEAEE